jgi:hypothetical protein
MYVNSINCTARLSIGCGGGVLWCGSSLIHVAMYMHHKYLLQDIMGFFFIVVNISHVPSRTTLKHVTSTYCHSSYLVFEITFHVAYFHRVVVMYCM